MRHYPRDRRSQSCHTHISGKKMVQTCERGNQTRDHSRGSQFVRQGSKVSTQRLSLISSYHQIPRIFIPKIPPPPSSLSPASSLSISDPDLSTVLHEETISLAFIQANAVIHKYVASRGQRERETDIYEVLPTTISVPRQKYSRRHLILP